MRFIRQKNSMDCGFAVAAMLAGVSYDAAKAIDPRDKYESRGLWLVEWEGLLNTLTGERWKIGTPRPARSFVHWFQARRPRRERGGVWLQHPSESWCHAIAFEGDRVFDPEWPGPVHWSAYDPERSKWVVKRAVYRDNSPGA